MINTNSPAINNFPTDNSSGVDAKGLEKKPGKNPENQSTNTGSNPFKESDSAAINKENTKNSEHPVTVIEFTNQNKTSVSGSNESKTTESSSNEDKITESGLGNKKNLSEDDIKIAEFISKMNNDTFEAILKSFDQMLANARKMMEEHQKILKEKIIPREEALKKEIVKEELQKEAIKQP